MKFSDHDDLEFHAWPPLDRHDGLHVVGTAVGVLATQIRRSSPTWRRERGKDGGWA